MIRTLGLIPVPAQKIVVGIEFPEEAEQEILKNSDGIGLYRTEFLYLGREKVPTEEDHFQAYTKVIQAMDGKPVITKITGEFYNDDKAGKPVAIHRFIGKVPVFCGGNSDGDQAMTQYTSGSKYKSMCMILHHTDSTREYAYDVKTVSGHLETALAEAKERNWMVVDMKKDFKKIFAFQ
jgi:hypothetical protein